MTNAQFPCLQQQPGDGQRDSGGALEQADACSAAHSTNVLLEQVMCEHREALYQYIYHFVGDYDTASDICQQVFIQLYVFLPTLQTNRPLTAWLFRAACHCCIDAARRKRAICFSELEAVSWSTAEEEYSSLRATLPDQASLPEEETEQHDLQRQLYGHQRSAAHLSRHRLAALSCRDELCRGRCPAPYPARDGENLFSTGEAPAAQTAR